MDGSRRALEGMRWPPPHQPAPSQGTPKHEALSGKAAACPGPTPPSLGHQARVPAQHPDSGSITITFLSIQWPELPLRVSYHSGAGTTCRSSNIQLDASGPLDSSCKVPSSPFVGSLWDGDSTGGVSSREGRAGGTPSLAPSGGCFRELRDTQSQENRPFPRAPPL